MPPHSWPLAAPRFPHLCQRQLLPPSSSGPKPWSQFLLFSFHQLLYPIRQQLLRVLSSKYLQTLKPACGAASLGSAPGFPVKPLCRLGVVGEGKGRDYCQAPKAGNSGQGRSSKHPNSLLGSKRAFLRPGQGLKSQRMGCSCTTLWLMLRLTAPGVRG